MGEDTERSGATNKIREKLEQDEGYEDPPLDTSDFPVTIIGRDMGLVYYDGSGGH